MSKKPIALALEEVTSALHQLTLFNAAMDSLCVFLISTLILILISTPWYYALIPFTIYASIHTYRAIKGITYRYVEDKVPTLKEQLRTAADHINTDNEIVQLLHQDVIKLMRDIKTSYFLNFGRLTRELIVLAVVSFLIIATSAYQVKFLSAEDLLAKLKTSYKPFQNYELTEEELIYEENTTEEIYGNKSVAELGNEELNLQINPVLSDINIGKVKDPEKKDFQDVPPREIQATTDTTFGENIPKGYQKIVKNYFREIAKG